MVEVKYPPDRTWVELKSDLKTTDFVMSDYEPDREYMFRVRPYNQYGKGDVSMAVIIVPKPGL